MARRFGRKLENPERRLENEGNFSQTVIENDSYDDEFDRRFDEDKRRETSLEEPQEESILDRMRKDLEPETTTSKREQFLQEIRVEQPQMDTPLILAYKELDRARKSRIREDIIKAEDRILDLERKQEEREYRKRIAEIKQMRKTARENNDEQGLKQSSKMRRTLIREMELDELNYRIRKLENSQRLSPSRENVQELRKLRDEFYAYEMETRE